MPSMLLDAQQITRVYGDRTVLDAVDVRVDAGSRIGLIGPNGAGKSALLHILAGRDAPDGGIVRCFGTVGYLPQFADVTERRLTVRETILDRVGLASAGDALDRWTDALAAGGLEAVQPHGAALERWLALGGADVDARLSAAVADLGLDEFLDRPLGTLSGGQAARAGLAALQVARFDVVLLDEPTNHLDADGLRRLESLLAARAGGFVLVSHDRALLAEAVGEIVELDRDGGRRRASKRRGAAAATTTSTCVSG
jgi:ATPase subunit of ABC transporter with duplicated ATPase domains